MGGAMNGTQMQITLDGQVKDKVEIAIQRIKTFEPPEGYYVAFSGGKDSQCVYHLCKMAGVKFDAHYSVTSVDPPELIYFIREHYPDVRFERRHDADGRPVTMWSLISEKGIPPTRIIRFCCAELKELNGEGRMTVTGVRAAESANRKKNQGVVTIPRAGVKAKKMMEENSINFTQTGKGGMVLNYDNGERRLSEYCIRTGKALLNPIIDWTDTDVWWFLNGNGIPHCCLYDEGFKRLGCIGCPMGHHQNKEFERYPKYRTLYLRAFERMLKTREEKGLDTIWETPEEVMEWWLQK